MIRLALAALCCAGLVSSAPKPMIRASVTSPRPIIVGQAVRVKVSVLVPNYFTGEPEFPQFDLDNAIVVLPGETPQNSSETIGGQTYAAITVTYLIYPQQPGSIKLPNADIGVKYASVPPKSVDVHLPLPTVVFEAVIPPQAADLGYFLPTTSLTISQKFDKPLKSLKVGDTFTRTVTIVASNLRAMLIPPTSFDVPPGITTYPKQPAVDDVKTDRGQFVKGKRIDSAVYLLRKQGEFTLPAIIIRWWNLPQGKLQTAVLPALHLSAGPNPGGNPEIPPELEPATTADSPKASNRTHYLRSAGIVAACLFVLGLLSLGWLRYGSLLTSSWAEFLIRRESSERALFSNLRKACRAGDAKKAYGCLLAWQSRFKPGVTLGAFVSGTADHELAHEIQSLTSRLYGHDTGTWSGAAMVTAVQRIRSHRNARAGASAVLPPLNPSIKEMKMR